MIIRKLSKFILLINIFGRIFFPDFLSSETNDNSLKEKCKLKNIFECKNNLHVMAELFYLVSNALSSQNFYSVSNFYINLAMSFAKAKSSSSIVRLPLSGISSIRAVISGFT